MPRKAVSKKQTKQPGWLNKKALCSSLSINASAFDKWGVQPIAKIGREVFYTVADVIENRLKKERDKNNEKNHQTDESKLEGERLKIAKLREEVKQLELRNAVLEGKSLPSEGVTKVLAKILSQSGDILDTLPLAIKRKFPDLDKRIIDSISETTISHQNEIAKLGDYIEEVIDDVQAEAEERIR